MDNFQELLIKCSIEPSNRIHERNVINFFVCSAFEDFELERKILYTRIFTKLQEKCFDQFGVEIKLIDVKLGLDSTLEVTKNYHSIFLENLDQHGICDQYNCPIILLGQKYGKALIPIRLELSVFELFKNTIKKYRKRFSVTENFLDSYYKLDTNSIKPEMVLIDAHEIFPDLYSEDKVIISKSREEWNNVKVLLSEVFEKLSEICLSDGTLDMSTVQNLFINELETGISLILKRSLDSEFLPIIFNRQIIDIKNFIQISNINNDEKQKMILEKFVDVYYDKEHKMRINEDSEALLRLCYDSCYDVYDNLEPTFEILWRHHKGICEDYHHKYIEQIEEYFTNKILEAVTLRAPSLSLKLSPNFLKTYDIIVNADYQVNKCSKLISGYENVCSTLIDQVTDQNENIPIILYGPPNSGKALVLARLISELKNIESYMDCHIITRFMNSSYTLNEVLLSIYLQISAVVLNENQFKIILENSQEIENNVPEDIEGVMFAFRQHTDSKFIIILHDLEKSLDDELSSKMLEMIPRALPENMKLIVTSTDNWEYKKNYFVNLRVPEFTQTEFNVFIHSQLHDYGKFLTDEQNENLLRNYLKFVNDILTATALVNYLKEFQLSNRQVVDVPPTDSRELFICFLNQWCKIFGQKIIYHSLLFIYCSQGGLTDLEIVDLLNMDKEVINELHNFYSESIIFDQETLKFPLSLWLIIKEELLVLLNHKMKDGYLLVDLATVSIVDSLINSPKENRLDYFHKILAEYYLGTWSATKRSFSFDFSPFENSYYCYPRSQKMFSKYGEKIFYNYRAFRQLVRHLSAVEMHDILLKEVIFNFDWLYYKTKALKVSGLLEDFYLSRNSGKEISLLEESFRNSVVVIEKDIDSLAAELIVQLLPFVPYYPNLRFLIENCDTIAPKHNAFIPIYPTSKLPGSPLASTIKCPGAIESVMIMENGENSNKELLIKLKYDSTAYFYDLTYGEISYNVLLSSGEIFFAPNTDVILVLETEYRQIIKVHKKSSGELIGQIIPMNFGILRPFEERIKYKITNIDVAKTKIALIITNEVSYLFVINLETLEPVLAFNPGIRLQMLKLTPDESTVFTHHVERLVSLNIEKNQLNSAVELQGVPFQMLFTKDILKKAFIVCNKQKGVVVLDLESSGVVSKCYKISFENCLDENDHVLEVSCSDLGNPYLLIRSCQSVILYDWLKEKVLSHITRPTQLPIYFKLPNQQNNQPASLQFNAARLILSDRVIVCALFRDIIVCTVSDNKVLKTLHAPVGGIISEIHMVDQYIIGKVDQNEDLSEVMIWKSDPSCLFSKIEINQDKLTRSINRIHVGESVAIATCDNSDEMGVIEISSGTLVDLYSHSSAILNSCLSSCGKWALVTVNNVHNANILWSLEARKIVFEFGNCSNTVFIVKMKSASGFLCITNHSLSIDIPNFIVTEILCAIDIEESHTMSILEIDKLGFIFEDPCFLNEDKILVFLSNEYHHENSLIRNETVLTIWTRENSNSKTGVSEIITVNHLSEQIQRSVEKLLSVKAGCSRNETVIVLYKSKEHDMDVLQLDCKSKTVITFLEMNEILSRPLDLNDIFISTTGHYLFHEKTCAIVDLQTNEFVGRISLDVNCDYNFRCFALRDTILVLSSNTKLIAWRLPEMSKIGQIKLKEKITYVSKCVDDFTLMVGCVNGSVLSYALIDIFSSNNNLSQIRVVRQFQPQSRSPTIQFEPNNLIQKTRLSQEFDVLNMKRPISEPIMALERREFSNIEKEF